MKIINQTEENIKELVILETFLNKAKDDLTSKEVYFDVVIVDNEAIKNINLKYRHIDRATDVISFAFNDDKNNIIKDLLGEIYISIDKAKEQAKQYNHSLERELCFLGIHGLLHLLGYDHDTLEKEKEMFRIQEEVLNKYEIKR